MSTPIVRLIAVSKRYDGVGGITRVSLEIVRGESVVVLGPSGSGKTTLLRLIAGLEHPDAGEIWLDGRQVAAAGYSLVPANERRVGFVFQDLALWPHLTVVRNLAFVADALGIDRRDRDQKIADVLRQCHVDPSLFDRHPHQLSGGEQQRVAVARALIGAPRLLLLDEPFSGLDQDLRAALRTELAIVRRTLQLTTICVTHDRGDAEALADRTIALQGSPRTDK